MSRQEHGEVDIDLLADYIGGALDGPDEAAVARLIGEDPRWREAWELLAPGMASVGADLGALGADLEPMPADLAGRLDAAFASPIAEPTVIDPTLATPGEPHLQPVRATGDGPRHLSAVSDSAVPGDGVDRLARRRKRLRWAAPIAAAAGVLAFAGFGIDYLATRSGGQADSGAAESSTAGGSGDNAAPMMGTDSAGGAAMVTAPADDQILATGMNYSATTLASEPVGTMVRPESSTRARKQASEPPAAAELSGRELQRLVPRDALLDCLEAIAQQNAAGPITVQTVDYARYAGAPALIVRFTSAGINWAWATGPDCGTPGLGAQTLNTVRVG